MPESDEHGKYCQPFRLDGLKVRLFSKYSKIALELLAATENKQKNEKSSSFHPRRRIAPPVRPDS